MVTKLKNSIGKAFKTASSMMQDCGDEYGSAWVQKDIRTNLWMCEGCGLVGTRKHQAETCADGTYPIFNANGFGISSSRNDKGRISKDKLQPIKPVEQYLGGDA